MPKTRVFYYLYSASYRSDYSLGCYNLCAGSFGPTNTDIPSTADPGRTLDDRLQSIQEKPPTRVAPVIVPENPVGQGAPKGAEKILFPLESITIDGMSRFEPNYFSYLYESSLGKKISVATLWNIAQSVTAAYRAEGHFLSKAYIPPQKIDDGHARISVIEGHIAEVHIKGSTSQDAILKDISQTLTRETPTHIATLERALLLLDQLYGVDFDAVLGRRKWEPGKVGEVVLTLIQKEDPSEVTFAANNYGSRYTGPYSTSITYDGSLLPYQQTSVSGFFNVIGGNELMAVNGQHKVQLTPEFEAKLQLSVSRSAPGYILKSQDIRGNSVKWGQELYGISFDSGRKASRLRLKRIFKKIKPIFLERHWSAKILRLFGPVLTMDFRIAGRALTMWW